MKLVIIFTNKNPREKPKHENKTWHKPFHYKRSVIEKKNQNFLDIFFPQKKKSTAGANDEAAYRAHRHTKYKIKNSLAGNRPK
jgi:hypothetical protein